MSYDKEKTENHLVTELCLFSIYPTMTSAISLGPEGSCFDRQSDRSVIPSSHMTNARGRFCSSIIYLQAITYDVTKEVICRSIMDCDAEACEMDTKAGRKCQRSLSGSTSCFTSMVLLTSIPDRRHICGRIVEKNKTVQKRFKSLFQGKQEPANPYGARVSSLLGVKLRL